MSNMEAWKLEKFTEELPFSMAETELEGILRTVGKKGEQVPMTLRPSIHVLEVKEQTDQRIRDNRRIDNAKITSGMSSIAHGEK
jgi:hypothetical protein